MSRDVAGVSIPYAPLSRDDPGVGDEGSVKLHSGCGLSDGWMWGGSGGPAGQALQPPLQL